MAVTLTVENIPDEIYQRIKATAAANHRSVNREVIACLEAVLRPATVCNETHMALARQIREELEGKTFKVTDIAKAIGR